MVFYFDLRIRYEGVRKPVKIGSLACWDYLYGFDIA